MFAMTRADDAMVGVADPERALALRYAPLAARPALTALWMLDERLGAIVARTSVSAIGQMRLTWWHDALTGLGHGAPPDEPILRTLAPLTIPAAAWPSLIDGWEVLLGPLPLDEAELAAFATKRGGTLFTIAATLLETEAGVQIEPAGRLWALADLARRITDPATRERALELARGIAMPSSWPPELRSLGALAVLARRDAVRPGRRERQASPPRVARMAWHRLTGR